MVAEPINLNKVRKAKAKVDAKRTASENVVKHGRTKAKRVQDAAQNEAAKKRLDQLKFEDE